MTELRSVRGSTMVEAMAAMALLTLAVTTSVSLIHDASRLAARHAAAHQRLLAAERLMERTLATPFETRASSRDARATVTVEGLAPGLQRIEVIVRDGRSRTRLVTLNTPWEGNP